MSLLERIRSKANILSKDPHPLRGEDKELRLSYIMAVAMMAVADGPLDDGERASLLELSASLGVSEEDCGSVVNRAAEGAEEDIDTVLRSVARSAHRTMLLFDTLMLMQRKGNFTKEEKEVWTFFAVAFKIPVEKCARMMEKIEAAAASGGVGKSGAWPVGFYGDFNLPEITLEKDGSVLLLVPEGEFEMGDGEQGNCLKHRVWLDAYYIGKYCVTNEQYARFVEATGHRPPNNTVWRNWEKEEHPVTDISWDDAMAYAEWVGCELPTEAQWEKAARGPNGYVYPWGNQWDSSRCQNGVGEEDERMAQAVALVFNHNSDQPEEEDDEKGTVHVSEYPGGVSGYGTYQQAGNVCEWCSDWYGPDYYKSTDAARNPRGPVSGQARMIRGGSWWDNYESDFRGANRSWGAPSNRDDYLGFRLARRA